jgi:hypothetical protein
MRHGTWSVRHWNVSCPNHHRDPGFERTKEGPARLLVEVAAQPLTRCLGSPATVAAGSVRATGGVTPRSSVSPGGWLLGRAANFS